MRPQLNSAARLYLALEEVVDRYRRGGMPEAEVQAVLRRALAASEAIVEASAQMVGVKRR